MQYFTAVARCGSLSKAADQLHYAQSNLSTKMGALEKELGTQLFYRNHRGITLTGKGEELLAYADKILGLVQQAKAAMAEEGEARGSLRIGALESIAETYLAPFLYYYHKNNPLVGLHLSTGEPEKLIRGVLDRELEGAFITGRMESPELVYHPFQRETLVLTASRRCPMESWRDLGKYPVLVLGPGNPYRSALEHFMEKEGILPREVMVMDSLGTLLSNVCAGLGVCFFPRAAVQKIADIQYLNMFPVPEPYTYMRTGFIHRKDLYPTKAVENFLQMLPKAGEREK